MNLLHNYGGACGPKRTSVQWQVLPITPVSVRFSMNEEVKRRVSALLKAGELSLEEIEENSSSLIPILEGFWMKQPLNGAVLFSPWKEETGEKPFTSGAGENSDSRLILAVEPLLVLNVLCRSRAGLLLPNLPLSLEVPFLKRDLVTADQRLILLANKEMYHG
jgi:hypothetical protein